MFNKLPHRGLWVKSTEIPLIKEELRDKVAKLSYIDVRRQRLPLYEAVLRELLEDGCTEAADNFVRLSKMEQQLIDLRVIKKRVLESNGLLVAIIENVRFAEKTCRLKGDRFMAITTIFQTACLIEGKGPKYNWLTKEFYIIINDLLSKWEYPFVFAEIECRSKYFFGKFLLRKVHAYIEAISQFERSLQLSRGKLWTTTKESTNILHTKASYYLSTAFLCEADRVYKKNAELAENLALQAAVVLSEEGNSKDKDLYCKANLRRCEYLIRCKLFDQTLKIHSKVQPFIYSLGKPDYKCEMFLQQGICYSHLDMYDLALRKLKQAIRLGEIYGLKHFKAHSLVQCGKVYSTEHNTFHLAQVSLKEAKIIFVDLKDTKNIKKVDYFCAILKAQEILPGLLSLIKSSGDDYCALLELREWKDQCRPFWCDDPDNYGKIKMKTKYLTNKEKNGERDSSEDYKCILKSMI